MKKREKALEDIKHITFYAYNILGADDMSEEQQMAKLKALGFDVPVVQIIKSETELSNAFDNMEAWSKSQDYDTDGAVIKANIAKQEKDFGSTAHHPNNAFAFKFVSMTAETTLKKIRWSLGYDKLTPVAQFDDVVLGGSVVIQASLHNLNIMEQSPLSSPQDKNKSSDSISDFDHFDQSETFQELLKGDIETLFSKEENLETKSIINNNKDNKDSLTEEEIKLNQNLCNFDVKLIDFGCSKLFNPKESQFQDKISGTLVYSAPEVLTQQYNEKCDIWSCGVLMYILLSGELPFKGVTESEIHDKIIRGRYCFVNRKFKNISFEAKDLMRKCFIYDPNQRITAKDALNHPFFKNEFHPRSSHIYCHN